MLADHELRDAIDEQAATRPARARGDRAGGFGDGQLIGQPDDPGPHRAQRGDGRSVGGRKRSGDVEGRRGGADELDRTVVAAHRATGGGGERGHAALVRDPHRLVEDDHKPPDKPGPRALILEHAPRRHRHGVDARVLQRPARRVGRRHGEGDGHPARARSGPGGDSDRVGLRTASGRNGRCGGLAAGSMRPSFTGPRRRLESAREGVELRPQARDGGRRLGAHAGARREVHRAAHLHATLAVDHEQLAGGGIARAGHERPALGHVRRGVRAGRGTDLQRIPGAHRRIEADHDLLAAALDQLAHTDALVDGALEAHEGRVRAAPQVRIGEAAVEGAAERRLGAIEVGRGELGPRGDGIEHGAVHPDDVVHVVGVLHAPLDLQRRDAGGHELGDVPHGQVVARAEQAVTDHLGAVLARLVHERVGQAARLRAVAAVRRAAAPHRRRRAGTGIADADGPMAKRLDADGRGAIERLAPRSREVAQLVERQLARAAQALDAQLAPDKADAGGTRHARLRGEVELDARQRDRERPGEPDVRDDEGVRAEGRRAACAGDGAVQLALPQVHVEGHVDPDAAGMGHGAGGAEVRPGDVVGRGACVERAHAAVHRVGARRDGGQQRVQRARGREKFRKGVAHVGSPLVRGGLLPIEPSMVYGPRRCARPPRKPCQEGRTLAARLNVRRAVRVRPSWHGAGMQSVWNLAALDRRELQLKTIPLM